MSDVVDGPGPAGIVAKDAVHDGVETIAALYKAAYQGNATLESHRGGALAPPLLL